MNIELVIFDMDGVIFDSEPVHYNSKLRILEELGLKRELDLSRHVGFPSDIFWQRIIDDNAIRGVTAKDLENRQYDYNIEEMAVNKIELSDGFSDVLDALDESGIDYAVASSSDKYFVHKVMEYYEIKDRFKAIVCGDEVPHKKPEPDIYLEALRRCGKTSEKAICIEDSYMGTLAAKAAEIRCAGYINPTSGAQDLSNTFVQTGKLADVLNYISK